MCSQNGYYPSTGGQGNKVTINPSFLHVKIIFLEHLDSQKKGLNEADFLITIRVTPPKYIVLSN